MFVVPAFPAGTPIAARFKLLSRCHNCYRVGANVLPVPDVDDAPRDVDELLESSFLKSLRFECEKCGSAISTLVGASPLDENDDGSEPC